MSDSATYTIVDDSSPYSIGSSSVNPTGHPILSAIVVDTMRLTAIDAIAAVGVGFFQ